VEMSFCNSFFLSTFGISKAPRRYSDAATAVSEIKP
jgi:hypothetical protein